MVNKLLNALTSLHTMHQDFFELLRSFNELLTRNNMSQQDMADCGYFLRELEKHLDDMRKDCKAHKELCSKLLSLRICQASLIDDSVSPIVKGQYARARAEVKVLPRLPAKGTPEYADAIQQLGATLDSNLIKLDFTEVGKLLTSMVEAGQQLPPAVSNTYTNYYCVYTKAMKKND